MRTDVLIIGGGATGAGIARDMAMRGASVLLLEKGDFSGGASGGNHGLLHSGARYAVKDQESARECADECEVLRHIAWHCIEDLGGLFIRLASDDAAYVGQFERGCHDSGVQAEQMSRKEILDEEPEISPEVEEGFQVRDASIDPFQLVLANVQAARAHGAIVHNHCPVVGMTREGHRISEVRYRDRRNGEISVVKPELVVNTAGAWSEAVAKMAGCRVEMSKDCGALLVMSGRLVNTLVNRLRPPSDGDIIVPNRTSMVLGTTSKYIEDPRLAKVNGAEVDFLLRETSRLVPGLARCRPIRAYASVRPLVRSEGEGRRASRSYQIYDHSEEGLGNFFSIVGGKLTTYRSMAEHMSDLLAAELGITCNCLTAVEPLVEHGEDLSELGLQGLPTLQLQRRYGRLPDGMRGMALSDPSSRNVACSCEQVCRFEMDHFASHEDVLDMSDLLRRTRAGMGYCQGTDCGLTMLAAMNKKTSDPSETMARFLCDRYKGVAPVLVGEQLRQELFRTYLLKGVYGFDTGEGSCR
jgi:glycerol-3-phosphate dehydrogenase